MVDFNDQVVLITGAGQGLGFSYARTIAQLGAMVLIQDIGADSDGNGADPNVAEAAAEKLRLEGLNAQALLGEIGSREGCHKLCKDALKIGGRLDALIHNAGWVAYENIELIEESSFDHMMAISAKAPLWLAQTAWPSMKGAGYGRIVVTTSCRALYPQYVQNGLASYAAAKMAVVGLMNVLASEGEKDGIIVNAVSPVAKTRMWGIEGEPDELRPADVAPGVAYLASKECYEGGWILRAANGQFHATKAMEAKDIDYPRNLRATKASTAQEVAENWSLIAIPCAEPRA
ncbi:UNVERIFIED_ORG: NAD(P)-dependent dehydrogenase (short-subunit alcohol dehydrogenase family) [Idiomarina abyssalis]|jgi:NAD(P)-dependent dehydrogenase (short-subunit alcohol dehydrogenase family)|uniref:Short chain dehydrogenase/reductase family protein n=1 Tax=Idiomarina loihiensis (strain ATCC BAA-735 / DSM 15497 / L2-TR) TaxID=283942 RepID=Q5R0U1_IDILO|nr:MULTISPECIES: SDR family NAD(P)-dependent oxidoreductase [Idiomarina]AAV82444.1 Short chain dehydrogenase/reductase family protein [Idiomarina loihiensis L2TR]AGM36481.1 Short chain dehydrogenase/reductase [Idiomarina loihiensis GSL 199]TDO53881.1 NAD(P)-dependent dehydrogenase (short-subunit alcohol dehydrogenase family) [Idiomarina sp. 017G]